MRTPIEAKNTGNALECRMATRADLFAAAALPEEIMVMPAGVHTIHVSQEGKPLALTVQVDRQTAATLQQALEAHLAGSPQKPYFDFDHDKASASGWPVQYLWRDTPTPGVYAKVEWSKPGADAITGKAFRSFSPTFYVDDDKGNPATVIGAPLNMGGLVNDPAFRQIQPLWAKRAQGTDTPMTPEEMAALQAALAQLKTENAELKAKAAGSESASAIAAKDTQITELNSKIVNLQDEITARRKSDAKAAVDGAVARGILPPKDTAIQAKWMALIESNPENAELLAKQPPITAAQTTTKPEGARAAASSGVTITRESYESVLKGYIEAKTARERGLVYRSEIDARLDKGEIIPFADLRDRLPLDAVNTLGTLVGNIISQRTLALVYSRRPMLAGIVTDFSDAQARLNQSVYTRIIGLPTMQDFGGAVSATADTDATVTLDQFKEVRFTFLPTEYLATARDLVREHSEALAVALGNGLVDAVAALITAAYTGVSTAASASFDYTSLIAHNTALNKAGVPDVKRFAWVNSDIAEAMRNDEVVMANFNRNGGTAYAHWQNIEGFENIWEYPALPANAINLTGFFAQQSAMALAARVPIDPSNLVGAGYPGRIQTVTDPVSGLSVVSNQWIVQDTLAINDRLILLYGAARANVTCGRRHVSA